MSNTHEEYELFVQKIIKELGAMNPQHQKEFIGVRTQRSIKVDVSFELTPLGGARTLYIVECKHYNHRVPVDDVEEFHSKLDDIGAHKGIMFTTIGYQSGAIKAARGRGIALAVLTKDRLSNQIDYIVNSDTDYQPFDRPNPEFIQGALYGLYGNYENPIRFNGPMDLYGMCVLSGLETSQT